jgi:hypothetical protein
VALVLIAVAVSLPALRAGLLNDDYRHCALLAGPSEFLDHLGEAGLAPDGSGRLSTALADQFITVDPNTNQQALKAYGALPWWTCDDLRVAFWRPVAALTHWVDHQLLPDSIVLMHLHSILWFAAVALAVSLLYRRLIGPGWIATLAGLIYVLADFSYFPTLWVANRNALIALFFGLWTLLLHDRRRRQGGRLGWTAPACLLVSLLSAEAGIATLAYLFAYEAMLRQERWAIRLRALAPFLVVTIGWRLVYNLLGYGAAGGRFYLDPAREPLRYALAMLDRAPFLLAGQWLTVPPDLYTMVSGVSKHILWVVLLLFAVAIPAAVWPLLRAERRARFWLVGMYLSALPVCATVPMGRTLLFIAVGAFGLIAEFVGGWRQQVGWVPTCGWRSVLVPVLAVATLTAHLPWAVVKRVTAPYVTAGAARQMTRTTAIGLLDWRRHEDLILVNAPNPAAFLYDPFENAYAGRKLPHAVRTLAPAYGALEIVRPRPRRLTVRSVSRSLLDCPPSKWLHFVFFYQTLSDVRGPDQPMRVGQRIVLPRMTVEITRVDERGLPVEATFDFPVPLEDASLCWLYWDWHRRRYAAFCVPEVGASVTLAGPFSPSAIPSIRPAHSPSRLARTGL